MNYRIARNPDVRASELALATRYSDLAGAVRDMATGVVFNDDGEVVAFHERHLDLLTRRANQQKGE